jgi:hypothetical protein
MGAVRDRLSEVWQEIKKARKLGPWAVLVLFLIEGLIQVARDLAWNWATALPSWIPWLADRPIGYFGLAAVALAGFLVLDAWWTTRPVPQVAPTAAEETKPPPYVRTPHEVESLRPLQTIWGKEGGPASSQALGLFWWICDEASEKAVPFSQLLRAEHGRFLELRRVVEVSLDGANSTPFHEVKQRFEHFYRRYFDFIHLMHESGPAGVRTLSTSRATEHRHWCEYHKRFKQMMEDLVHQTGYKDIRVTIENLHQNDNLVT